MSVLLAQVVKRTLGDQPARTRILAIVEEQPVNVLVASVLILPVGLRELVVGVQVVVIGFLLGQQLVEGFARRGDRLPMDELAMLMGGRTAEELVFADPTTRISTPSPPANSAVSRLIPPSC